MPELFTWLTSYEHLIVDNFMKYLHIYVIYFCYYEINIYLCSAIKQQNLIVKTMKANNKQSAMNKAAAMNAKMNANGDSGQRYGVAEDIRTGKYVPATMAQIFNSQYLRIVI